MNFDRALAPVWQALHGRFDPQVGTLKLKGVPSGNDVFNEGLTRHVNVLEWDVYRMKGTFPSRACPDEAAVGNEVPRWGCKRSSTHSNGEAIAILYFSIDLAKNVFAVHGVDEHGKPAQVHPALPRAKLHPLIAALPPRVPGMEAGLRYI